MKILWWAVLGVCLVVGCTPRGTPPDEYERRVNEAKNEYDQAVAAKVKELGLVLENAPAGGHIEHVGDGGRRVPMGPSLEAPKVPVRSADGQPSVAPHVIELGWTSEDQPSWEEPRFARDADGKLWLLSISVKSTGTIWAVRQGCRPGWDKGTPPGQIGIQYVMPGEIEFAGAKEIAISVRTLEQSYADGMCQSDGPAKP